jgi:hypothetical protein
MIELTAAQSREIAANGETPTTFVDPLTQAVYVLIPKSLYERLSNEAYDDSPWTAEERDALAWEAAKHAEWGRMDEYDDQATP